MRGRGGMERIPGQDGGELSADEAGGTPAPLDEGPPPLRSRVRAGLVTAVAIVGFATFALAYWLAPWHRAAVIAGDHPQRQGEKRTRLFHSMEDLATHLTQDVNTGQSAYVGSREIYVENSDVFKVGDNIVILDPSGDSSMNEEGVVERVDPGKLTLERPVSKSLSYDSPIVVQANAPSYSNWDCDAGYSNWAAGWSENKKKACCQKEKKGCSFDCTSGYEMWQSGWSGDKKKFCCDTEQRGCDEASKEFDCESGDSNWIAGWSERKKQVCCATEGKGCTFDCSAGYTLSTAGWSQVKKEYCCQSEERGCGESGGGNGGPWAVVLWLFLLLGIIACCIALVLACLVVLRGNGQSGLGFLRPFQNSLATLWNSLVTLCCSPKSGRSKKGKGKQWIFKPADERAIICLDRPEYDAPETGEVLEPREKFMVSQEQVPKGGGFREVDGGVVIDDADAGTGDAVFLKLDDGRGWVLDRESGHEMCYRLNEPVMELWVYDPENGKPLPVREEPDIDAEHTGDLMHPGDRFVVGEIQADGDGVLFLRLTDERGWVFDEGPGGDVLCRRCLEETWAYRPDNGMAISIRKTPDVYGEKTTYKVYKDETFQVSEIYEGEDGVKYLKLEDGRGWLFDKHPENGDMCFRSS